MTESFSGGFSNNRLILEDNFTNFPNVACDYWMRRLTPAEWKVLTCIGRKTFGWGKERDKISLSQIKQFTGLGRTGIVENLKVLESLNLISKAKSKSRSGGNGVNIYEIKVHRSKDGKIASKSPILRPSYTMLPNIFFDYWMAALTPGEWKVLTCIGRKTFGWGNKEDRVSLRQLSNYTGLSQQGIIKCLKNLEHHDLIKKFKFQSDEGDADVNQYLINVQTSDDEEDEFEITAPELSELEGRKLSELGGGMEPDEDLNSPNYPASTDRTNPPQLTEQTKESPTKKRPTKDICSSEQIDAVASQKNSFSFSMKEGSINHHGIHSSSCASPICQKNSEGLLEFTPLSKTYPLDPSIGDGLSKFVSLSKQMEMHKALDLAAGEALPHRVYLSNGTSVVKEKLYYLDKQEDVAADKDCQNESLKKFEEKVHITNSIGLNNKKSNKKNKEIENIENKKLYGKFVLLTDEEYQELQGLYTPEKLSTMIEMLNDQLGVSPPKKAYSHYYKLRPTQWVSKQYDIDQSNINKINQSNPKNIKKNKDEIEGDRQLLINENRKISDDYISKLWREAQAKGVRLHAEWDYFEIGNDKLRHDNPNHLEAIKHCLRKLGLE